MKTKQVIMAITICIFSALAIVLAILGQSETQIITTSTVTPIQNPETTQNIQIDLNQATEQPNTDIATETITSTEELSTTTNESTSTEAR